MNLFFNDVCSVGIVVYYVTAHALQRSFVTFLLLFITFFSSYFIFHSMIHYFSDIFFQLFILYGFLHLHHDFFINCFCIFDANFLKIMNEKRNAFLFHDSMFVGCRQSKKIWLQQISFQAMNLMTLNRNCTDHS